MKLSNYRGQRLPATEVRVPDKKKVNEVYLWHISKGLLRSQLKMTLQIALDLADK